MKSESILSGESNIALGIFPLIAAMLLNELVTVDNAVYIGAGIGLFLSAVYHAVHRPKITHFILYSNTVILSIFSVIVLTRVVQREWLQDYLPLVLEITIIFPLLILYFYRKKYSLASYKGKKAKEMKEQIRVTVLTMGCIRVFFVLVAIHFVFIAAVGIFGIGSPGNKLMWFLQHIAPLLVFALTILIGFVGINVLRTIKDQEFVPIVTASGEVIGKINKDQLEAEHATTHTFPIIRMAVVSHDMLFLAKRSSQSAHDKDKFDIPLETYLLCQEDVKCGVERLLKEAFPRDWKRLNPCFSIKYRFKSHENNRLVYLFILDLGTDDAVICDPKFDCGKLWTFQQIEYNLSHAYFGEMFENEYEHFKTIIETRGKYKES